MVDRVRGRKFENPATGGTQTDLSVTGVNPNEDFQDCRGVTYQNDTSDDDNVRASRDASDNMTFTDPVTGLKTLAQLVASGTGVSEESHKTLLQLIHFIDEGPAEGFTSPATKTVTGGLFPTLIEWRRQDATLLVEKTITRSGGGASNIKPTPVVWKVFDTDGTTVLTTVSDAITYSGINEASRVRTIS